MKRFKYSLENVLHYKEQILDSIKAEHGTLLAQIRKKEAEIQELENKLVSAQNKMDDLKKQDVQIKDICLYGMYISEMEDQIRKKQEQLKLLQQQEEKKKVQVIAAKTGVSLLAFEVYAFYIKSVARSFYSQLLLLWIPMRTKFPLCFLSAFFLMLFLIPFI